jgi:hypothetical protein
MSFAILFQGRKLLTAILSQQSSIYCTTANSLSQMDVFLMSLLSAFTTYGLWVLWCPFQQLRVVDYSTLCVGDHLLSHAWAESITLHE